MKYLALRRFTSMGKLFVKGDEIDESEIKSPRLRLAEGKIIPVVSSSEVPVEVDGIVELDTSTTASEESNTINDSDSSKKPLFVINK